MRAVVTRVNSASVSIDGTVVGEIGRGFLILLGVAPGDTPALCKKLAEKVLGLRVFRDENDKMNLSLSDIGGAFFDTPLTVICTVLSPSMVYAYFLAPSVLKSLYAPSLSKTPIGCFMPFVSAGAK